jgi:hypothetical protein
MTNAALPITKDDFHRERSRFIDAFAGLEEALLRIPKATIDKVLADELKALRAIRNDLVHSQLRFVQLEGQLQAIALNVQDSTNVARQGRLLRMEDFPLLAEQVNDARQKVATAA